MSDVLDFLLGIAILVVAGYMVIFGGIGAVLARSRDGSAATGFVVGLLPLVGWPLVLWVTREGGRKISADEWLEREDVAPPDIPTAGRGELKPTRHPTAHDPHDY